MVEIGKWIDDYLDNKENHEHIINYGEEDANMELLDIAKIGVRAYVNSCDMEGNVGWHHITNVTRHDHL
jgi:hypothetical protein